jgi:hypothetical protein
MFDARIRYLCNTNEEYAKGYDAAALCLPLDKTQSADWQAGWRQWQKDIDYAPPTPSPPRPAARRKTMNTHHVILRHDGIDRTYACANRFDAIVLFDALETRYGSVVVELWDGLDRIR